MFYKLFFATLIFMLIGILICIVLSVAGCNSGRTWPGQKPPIVKTPETPQQQLWHTVKKSNWLVTLAIPIIALGAVAMFNGAAKLGMSAMIFGAVNLFMALATARFALWMGIFGLIGSATAVVASILTKNKALKEIIKGVQNFKDGLREADRKTIKTDAAIENINGHQTFKQSLSTEKIVRKIKAKLKLKKEI